MDQEHFDDLTRSVAGGGSTRRAAMRLLAGSALAGVAARLGLTAVTEAKNYEAAGAGQFQITRRAEERRKGQEEAPQETRQEAGQAAAQETAGRGYPVVPPHLRGVGQEVL